MTYIRTDSPPDDFRVVAQLLEIDATVRKYGTAATPVIRLEVPGHLDYRELVTRATSLACKVAVAGATGEGTLRNFLTNAMVSAVGEAFNNIVLHGYRGVLAGTVRVEISWDSEALRIQLSDNGASFDPHTVSAPDLMSLPESGMGLFIIRSFVDSMEYTSGPPNVLVLTKNLPRDSRALTDYSP